ncbi:MAG: hypothetical protein JWN53_1020 [Gemmatimonadetes bacterium]|nr:hypothetical protein [Gemmatimonadota bacterium]
MLWRGPHQCRELHSTTTTPVTRAAVSYADSRLIAQLRRVVPHAWALAIVLLVVGSAPFAVDSLRDSATLLPTIEATLRRPIGYVLLAPLSDLLDLLSLLSLRQHVALVLTLVLGYAVWWWRLGRFVPETVVHTPARRRVRQAVRIGLALLALVGAYALAVLLPRPMAALEVAPRLLVVDFHAHTRYSHDGRPDWTPEDVRNWHRDAGFAATYISDHRSYEGSREGWGNNPPLAGEGVSLLPAIEVVWKGEHVNVLDADRVYANLVTPTLRDVDEEALRLASMIPGKEPIVVFTLPGHLEAVIPARGPRSPGVRAIELVDGAPQGLDQSRRERQRIVHLADSLDLALVSGSNHHGWGHTASAWTLFSFPQWRALPPDQLADAIATMIRQGGRSSTSVIERYVADTDTGIALPLTAPLVVWGMFRTLTADERVAWIGWTVLIFLLARLLRMRRGERLAD